MNISNKPTIPRLCQVAGKHQGTPCGIFNLRETQWYSTWSRLGPGPLCCSACTWTHLFSSNRIQRNCMGLKITARMRSWGKFRTKDKKRPKHPTATSFEEPRAKAGGQNFPGGAACQCRGHGFDPWSGKIPHAAEQLSPGTTTTEPAL